MKCFCCSTKMKKEKRDLDYTDCGLKNVVLRNIDFWVCPTCGEEEYELSNLAGLHELLASAIAEQPNKLLPEEIRFLRTHLGWGGKEFARHISVVPETVSRWENGKGNIDNTAEKLLRLYILKGAGPFRDYDELQEMGKTIRKTSLKRTIEFKKNNIWKPLDMELKFA